MRILAKFSSLFVYLREDRYGYISKMKWKCVKMFNLLIFLARKSHAIWRVEVPMAICVAKIDFVNEETH